LQLQGNYRLILAHIVPPFASGISRDVGDVEVPGGERWNVQTGWGGDRLSAISQLGCSTSRALATGPTERRRTHPHIQWLMGFFPRGKVVRAGS